MSGTERIPSAPHSVSVRGVDVFRWLPRRFAALPEYQPENFGDSLALELVQAIAQRQAPKQQPARSHRLLSIGSVLHFARQHDVVWGSGVNGKVDGQRIGTSTLDVRAVRGPKTRELLLLRDVPTPEVYGDPGLLLPEIFPGTRNWAQHKRRKLALVPNFNDARSYASHPDFVNPLAPLWSVIRAIAESELVIASSLHGIVIAEALGVPVRPLVSEAESSFKYEDYALGTGRDPLETSETLEHALAAGPIEPLEWDASALLEAFPYDLWHQVRHSHAIIADSDAAALQATLASVAEQLADDDEVLIGLTSDNTDVRELAERAARRDTRIRLRSLATLTSSGTPWDFMMQWASGTTVSMLTAGSRYRERIITSANELLARSDAIGVFGRAMAFGRGPDDDRMRTMMPFLADNVSLEDSDQPLSVHPDFVPSLLDLDELAGAVLSTDAVESHGGLGRGALPVFGVIAAATERETPVFADPRLTALHARPERHALNAAGLTAFFMRCTEVFGTLHERTVREFTTTMFEVAGDALVHAASLSELNDDAVAQAAQDLFSSLLPTELTDSLIAGPLILTMLGLGELITKEGSQHQALPHASAGRVIDRLFSIAATIGVDFARPVIDDSCSSSDFISERTRSFLRGLDSTPAALVIDSLRRGLAPLFDVAEHGRLPELRTIAAAFGHDPHADHAEIAFTYISAASITIERVSPTPLGFSIAGTMPQVLAGQRVPIWVRDAGTGREAQLGALNAVESGQQDSSGRISFSGHVRHVGAPAGKLELRLRTARRSMVTIRTPARKVLGQLLRPVEIPLDGGTALLVRRPSPISVLRARLGH